jgi:hypothetical protein
MASETRHAPELFVQPTVARSGSRAAREKPKPPAHRALSEDHRIVSQAQGEPLPKGCVGVRVRVRLSGCPSRRWSRALCARLVNELVGHAAVGHLRLDDIVQGDQIVLEGVEAKDAWALASALGRAIDAANHMRIGAQKTIGNVAQEEADAIAAQVALGYTSIQTSVRSAADTCGLTPTHWFG